MNDLLARFFAEDNMRQIPENVGVNGYKPQAPQMTDAEIKAAMLAHDYQALDQNNTGLQDAYSPFDAVTGGVAGVMTAPVKSLGRFVVETALDPVTELAMQAAARDDSQNAMFVGKRGMKNLGIDAGKDLAGQLSSFAVRPDGTFGPTYEQNPISLDDFIVRHDTGENLSYNNDMRKNPVISKILEGKYGIDELDNDFLHENNYFVHGRDGGMDLSNDGLVLMTQDMETAKQYGRDGSIHFIKDNFPQEKVMDLSDPHSTQMQEVVDAAHRDEMFDDYIDAVQWGKEITPEELMRERENLVRASFAPDNIVDSAAGFDNPDFYQWFSDNFGHKYDIVYTPDGAVLLNKDGIDSVAIPYNEEMNFDDDYGKTVIKNFLKERGQ